MEISTFHLPASGIVASLSKSDREVLADYGKLLTIEPGEALMRAGHYQDKLIYLVSGHLELLEPSHAGSAARMLPEGEWLGECDIFDPTESVTSAIAVGRVQAWQITREQLAQYIEFYPDCGLTLYAAAVVVLARRLRSLQRGTETTHSL